MDINTLKLIVMKAKEVQEITERLREEKWRLQRELEENGGEVTEAVLTRQQTIADLKALLRSPEGVDSLGRLMRSNKDEIDTIKGEMKFLGNQVKQIEGYNEWLLEVANEAMEEMDEDKVKGALGYSFTRHTSVTTEVDKAMLKELFYEKAIEAIRKTDIPQDVTITLSASVSALPEGAELPEWYNVSSVGRATLRMPRKPKEPKKDEFTVNEFV